MNKVIQKFKQGKKLLKFQKGTSKSRFLNNYNQAKQNKSQSQIIPGEAFQPFYKMQSTDYDNIIRQILKSGIKSQDTGWYVTDTGQTIYKVPNTILGGRGELLYYALDPKTGKYVLRDLEPDIDAERNRKNFGGRNAYYETRDNSGKLLDFGRHTPWGRQSYYPKDFTGLQSNVDPIKIMQAAEQPIQTPVINSSKVTSVNNKKNVSSTTTTTTANQKENPIYYTSSQYKAIADNVAGKSREAVRRFQKEVLGFTGKQVDGIWGKNTQKAYEQWKAMQEMTDVKPLDFVPVKTQQVAYNQPVSDVQIYSTTQNPESRKYNTSLQYINYLNGLVPIDPTQRFKAMKRGGKFNLNLPKF